MEDKKHDCGYDDLVKFNDDESADISYCNVEKIWALIGSHGTYEDEVSVYIPITFCPFCGEKLE